MDLHVPDINLAARTQEAGPHRGRFDRGCCASYFAGYRATVFCQSVACIANENDYHLLIMTLSQLALGEFARVTRIEGGHGVQRNLNQLGIHVGDVMSIARRGAFRGPSLVLVHGMQVALGRGVATHVHVEPMGANAALGRTP